MNRLLFLYILFIAVSQANSVISLAQDNQSQSGQRTQTEHETHDNPYLPPVVPQRTSQAIRLKSAGFSMVQVNVNSTGQNILGDAANEPSMTIDPADPSKIVIGWRQFDNVNSNFRQAGYAYSSDYGQTWTFPGVIEPGVFRSDPVLDADITGAVYYNSLTDRAGAPFPTNQVFKSSNDGVAWGSGVEARGGDKQWMTIDHTIGVGSGNLYSYWYKNFSSCFPGQFTRSKDEGVSYQDCVEIPNSPRFGTLTVGNEGELYVIGSHQSGYGFIMEKSSNAKFPDSIVSFELSTMVGLDGYMTMNTPVNPEGGDGQAYIDVDRSSGPGRGNVYVLATVARYSNNDPADIMFAKSTDGGVSWSTPHRINTDSSVTNYQWFGTLSVAPNGRIDVVWLDTRNAPAGSDSSALYYSYSNDQGETWSANEKLSESFNPHAGYPQQNKMGDYFDMKSDNEGASLAWTNTFNGEEDVYFSRIIPSVTGINNGVTTTKTLSLVASPNPFCDETAIKYSLSSPCRVKLVIYNLYGTVIQTLVENSQPAGNYSVSLADNALSSGFYICRLDAGLQSGFVRLVKVK